jgi:gas vesicle structural protein
MPPEEQEPWSLAARLAEDVDYWDPSSPGDEHTLVDLVNRVLDKGVVITGDITISVAGVDLVYLGLNAVLTSVSTARETLGREVGPKRDGS